MEDLVCAAEGGDVHALENMLRRTTSHNAVNTFDTMGYAPIHYASSNGHHEVVRIILDNGGDVNLKNPTKGQTPLHCACNGCHVEVVKVLLAKPEIISSVNATTKKFKYTPLHCVAVSGKSEAPGIVDLLLRHGALIDKLDETGSTPFLYACRRGDSVATVQRLLKHRASPFTKDKNGATAMHMAAIAGSPEIIQLLHRVGVGANGEADKKSPLPPLHLAAKHGHAAACTALLRLGARPDCPWRSGRRALHMAAYAGHEAVVQALVKVKADINAQDADEYTPVAYAAFQGNQRVVALLVTAGANVLIAPRKTGMTPLHLAAKEGQRHCGAVVALASTRALNATDRQGRTPLHFTAMRGDINMAEVLLRAGADATIQNKRKRTAAQVAASKGHQALAQLLTSGVGMNKLQSMSSRTSAMLATTDPTTTALARTGTVAGRGVTRQAATLRSRPQVAHYPPRPQQPRQHKQQPRQPPRASAGVRHQRRASDGGPAPPSRHHRPSGSTPATSTQRITGATAAHTHRGGCSSGGSTGRKPQQEQQQQASSENGRVLYLKEQMAALRREEENMLKHSTFPHVFASLRHIGRQHTAQASRASTNVRKNRYGDIVAYDHTRVTLDTAATGSDYINANFISGYKRPKAYIACQGPLANTAADFWQMVWEQNSSIVVMVASLVEKNRQKCFKYWPGRDDGAQAYGAVQVTLTSEAVGRDFIRREFTLAVKGKTRRVSHLQMTSWPDHGAPRNATAFLRLHNAFNRLMRENRAAGPAVVHCSAGVGRSGTLICMDILYEMALDEKQPLNIRHVVSRLREQRNFMVQSVDQFRFLYTAACDMLTALVARARAPVPAKLRTEGRAVDGGRGQAEEGGGEEGDGDEEGVDSEPTSPQHLEGLAENEQMEMALTLSLSELEGQAPAHDQPSYNSQPYRSQTLSLPVNFELQYVGSQKVLKESGSSVISAALAIVLDRTKISRRLRFSITHEGIELKEHGKQKSVLYKMPLISCFQCGQLSRALQSRQCARQQTAYLVFIAYAPRKHIHVAHVFLAPSIDDVDEVNMYIAHAMEIAAATRTSHPSPQHHQRRKRQPATARGAPIRRSAAAPASASSRVAPGPATAMPAHQREQAPVQTADELLQDAEDDDVDGAGVM